MNTLIVIQARVGSTRLPNKILLPLAGAPLLQRLIERVQTTEGRYEIVVGTTFLPEDEPVRMLCNRIGVQCYGGHPTDLLDRHYRIAKEMKADIVVKIPSDCPLIDPTVIDAVIGRYYDNDGRYDYVSNLHPPTYPDGNDVEVMSFSSLEIAWREATKTYEREHTTTFLWEHPERFRIGNYVWENGLDYSMSHRWTIDYPEDYTFISRVYKELWRDNAPAFSLYDILALLEAKPEIHELNVHRAGINWYRHHLHELRTINAFQTRQES